LGNPVAFNRPHTEEERARVSAAVKLAYAEGRKQPVRAQHRKGTKLTDAQKAQISATLTSGHHVPWNKGAEMGPRPESVRQQISATLTGRSKPIAPEKATTWKAKISASKRGKAQSTESNEKRSSGMLRAYAEGRKVVSAKSGYGKRVPYLSPFQGVVTLRSTSELQRAQELDALNLVWFYEVQRFSVAQGTRKHTYTPDFWVVPGVSRVDVPEDFRTYLRNLPAPAVDIEDVKGWWGPKHRTYAKIQAFQEQYPELRFRIVQRDGSRSPTCLT